MSKEGCWQCGSVLHHRRDCDAEVSQDSAVLVKKFAMADQRQHRQKTETEKSKWEKKQEIRVGPALPRSFLKKHIGISLQILYDTQVEYDLIGEPSLRSYAEQLQTVLAIQSKLRGHLEDMHDIVAHGKRYLKSNPRMDEEDKLFKSSLEKLDECRQPIMIKLSKIVAVLQEIKRKKIELFEYFAILKAELSQGQLLLDERSSSANLEQAAVKVRDATPIVHQAQTAISALKMLCTVTEAEDELATLRRGLEGLWEGRGSILEGRLEKIYCPICNENEKEIALTCGHQLCHRCLHQIRGSRAPHCPFCKGGLGNALRIYNN